MCGSKVYMKNAQTSSYYILWTCALCISEDRILPLLENAKGTRLEAVLYHNMVVAITWLEIRQRSSQREQEKMASHIKALANLICTYFNNNHRYGLNLFYEVTKVYVCRMFCQVFFFGSYRLDHHGRVISWVLDVLLLFIRLAPVIHQPVT